MDDSSSVALKTFSAKDELLSIYSTPLSTSLVRVSSVIPVSIYTPTKFKYYQSLSKRRYFVLISKKIYIDGVN